MATFESLTPSERIIAFLDGELPESETSKLFSELSLDPDLQEEMRQHTLLRGWMPKVLPAPPTYLKKRIAGNLGLIGYFPTAVRYGLLAILLFTFAGGAAYYGYFKNEVKTAGATNSNIARTPERPNYDIPELYSGENAHSAINKDRNVSGLPAVRDSRVNAADIRDVPAQEVAEPSPDRVLTEEIGTSLAERRSIGLNKKKVYPTTRYIRNEPTLASLSRLSFVARKINSFSFPNLEMEAPGATLLGDYILGLDYSLDNGDAVGVELGNEAISQEFAGHEKGSKTIYKQVYRGFWGAALYRYSLPALADGVLRPQISLGAGYYEMGPLGRASAGLEYYMTDNFIISVRAETSIFFYSYDSKPYATVKPGVSYGLKFKM